jgi:hypothetical protein
MKSAMVAGSTFRSCASLASIVDSLSDSATVGEVFSSVFSPASAVRRIEAGQHSRGFSSFSAKSFLPVAR